MVQARIMGTSGQKEMDLGSASACQILSLFSWPNMFPASPQTYARKIVGVGLIRSIDDKAVYREVSTKSFCSPLLGSLVTPPT